MSRRIAIHLVDGVLGGGGVSAYTISGTVYDADGSTPVEGATVTLGELTDTSAADGTYTIADVPAGTSGSMTCTKTGYSWTAITVAAMSGNLTTQNYTNAWWAGGGSAAGCYGAFRAIGAASLAASYVNIITPGTGNLTTIAAPTFDAATGWTCNGSQALLFPLAIATGSSAMFRYSDRVGDGCFFGSAVGSADFAVQQSGATRYFDNGTQTSVVNAATSGVIGLTDYGYSNGTAITTQMSGAGDHASGAGIGGNKTGAANVSASFNGKIQAVAFYNIILTPTQVGIITTAMANLT
jgi:hypothetical protein